MTEKTPSAADLRTVFDSQVSDDADIDDKEKEKVTDDLDHDDVDDDDFEEELSEEEQEAVKHGWNPNYKGKNAVSAKEFIARGSFFKKIDAQNKVITDLQKQVEFLVERTKTATEAGYQQAIVDLKAQKRNALEEGDYDRVVEIDDEIDATRDKMKEETVKSKEDTPTIEIPAEIQAWQNKNSWFAENPEMKAVAESIGQRYLDTHRPSDPMEVLDHIEGRIKHLYPDYFDDDTSKKKKGSPVEGTSNRRSSSKRGRNKGVNHSVSDLAPEDQMVMKSMLQKGQIKSEEDYIKSLEQVGYFN